MTREKKVQLFVNAATLVITACLAHRWPMETIAVTLQIMILHLVTITHKK
jgi:hypothetical protein